jgi:hypothetical protein
VRNRVVAAVPLVLSFACGPPVEPDGTPGALNFGAFEYCETKDTCDGSRFPDRIAVGTSFYVSFEYANVASDGRLLDATTNDDGSTIFHVRAEGKAKITASDEDGTLLDYLTVSTSDAASLELEQCPRSFNALGLLGDDYFDPGACKVAPPSTTLQLSRGSSLAPTLCLRMLDASGHDLGGAPDARWSVTKAPAPEHTLAPPDPRAMLQLTVARDARCASVGALTVGDAALSVSLGDLTTAVSVTAAP